MDQLNKWLTLFANLGVLVGIGVLIFEVRHNTESLVAANEWQEMQTLTTYYGRPQESEALAMAIRKQRDTPGELTGPETTMLINRAYEYMQFLDTWFILYNRGMMSDEAWQRKKNAFHAYLQGNPRFHDQLRIIRGEPSIPKALFEALEYELPSE